MKVDCHIANTHKPLVEIGRFLTSIKRPMLSSVVHDFNSIEFVPVYAIYIER